MGKTNKLRALVQTKLKTVCNSVYFLDAQKNALFPHVVFNFENTLNDDPYRDDITISIDVWDRSTSNSVIEDLCDDIEELFRGVNIPQTDILPTFFLVNRVRVIDEDKQIKHISMRLLVQNYER